MVCTAPSEVECRSLHIALRIEDTSDMMESVCEEQLQYRVLEYLPGCEKSSSEHDSLVTFDTPRSACPATGEALGPLLLDCSHHVMMGEFPE